MNPPIFILSIVVGFLIAHLTSGKVEGRIGFGILLFKTKYHTYHIHHWMTGILILLIMAALRFYNDIIYGLITGFIIQGMTYRDFHKIKIKREYKK